MSHGRALKVASGLLPFIPQPCFMMGRPSRVPIAFLHQSPSIHHTNRHPPPPLLYLMHLALTDITSNCFYPSCGRVFSCGIWTRGAIEVLVSGVANLVVINQMSCHFLIKESPIATILNLGLAISHTGEDHWAAIKQLLSILPT